jgi:hypothetical protein
MHLNFAVQVPFCITVIINSRYLRFVRLCYCYCHFIRSLNQTRVLDWKWIPIFVTVLSVQSNTEYWDYCQCCNLRAAVPWGCRWSGRAYAERGHGTYSVGTTVCHVVRYLQLALWPATLCWQQRVTTSIHSLRTVRLWLHCAVIWVLDTAHHTSVLVWNIAQHTNSFPQFHTPIALTQ